VREIISAELQKSAAVIAALLRDDHTQSLIQSVAVRCVDALRADRKVLFAGNGGSAADAQHLAAELVSRLAFDRPGLAAVALTTDTSVLTAVGNDYGYEKVFARQIGAVGQPNDVLFAISTSGRSLNILQALHECRLRQIVTIGLTGRGGGDMVELCDYCIRIPSDETAKIQEGHIVVGHIICGLIELAMFARSA
jgi:D-sedoheptulose 7-phosphate isomerase